MSRIDDLIAQHCPDGVEFKALGEVGQFVRGNGLQKKDFVANGYPCIHYGQIYTFYGTATTTTKSFISSELASTLKKAYPGDLVVTTTSENIEDVCKAVAWLGDGPIAVGGHACIYEHRLDPLYVAYYFQTEQFELQKRKFVTGTKVKDIKVSDLARIEIPVPPLAVQREIVAILDKMERLQAELEAELELRSRQYAFYRDSLLTFAEAPPHSVRWVPMGELGTWIGGITPSKSQPRYWESGTIPWVASMDISATSGRQIRGRVTQAALDETPLRVVSAPSVAVVMRSNILRRSLPIGFVDVDTTANQDMRLLKADEGVDPRYVYQALLAASEEIRNSCVRTDGSMAAVDSKAFFAYQIPVPSLAEQHRIVAILDKFDALVNDLSEGLPAEINARAWQYAYYRDKLLTFEEAAA